MHETAFQAAKQGLNKLGEGMQALFPVLILEMGFSAAKITPQSAYAAGYD